MAPRATLLRAPEAAPGTGREAGLWRRIRAESCEGGHQYGLGEGRTALAWGTSSYDPSTRVHVNPRQLWPLRRATLPRFPSVGPTFAAVKSAACSVRAPRLCCTAPCTWCSQTGCRHHRMALLPALTRNRAWLSPHAAQNRLLLSVSGACEAVSDAGGGSVAPQTAAAPGMAVPACPAPDARCLCPAILPPTSSPGSAAACCAQRRRCKLRVVLRRARH